MAERLATAVKAERRRPGEPVGLPGYAWSPGLRNYVDLETGRMVSRRAVEELLRVAIGRVDETSENLGAMVARGEISPQEFMAAMMINVRHGYNASVALASGGWHQVSQADWGVNGALLREAYGRLRNFAADILIGRYGPLDDLNERAIVARAGLYANTAFGRFWDIEDERQRALGMRYERLETVGDDRVCPICRQLERRGWVMIGTYKMPIHAGCRCGKRYAATLGEKAVMTTATGSGGGFAVLASEGDWPRVRVRGEGEGGEREALLLARSGDRVLVEFVDTRRRVMVHVRDVWPVEESVKHLWREAPVFETGGSETEVYHPVGATGGCGCERAQGDG